MQGIIYFIGQARLVAHDFQQLPGQYLLKPVHTQTLRADGAGRESGFFLRFFDGSARSVCLAYIPLPDFEEQSIRAAYGRACALAEVIADVGVKPEVLGRFVWSDSPEQMTISAVSRFFRGSATLTAEAYQQVGQRLVAADARGLAVLCSDRIREDRAERVLSVYMLGLAYYRALAQVIDELAALSRKREHVALERMHEEVSHFLAASYFDEPAHITTIEVGPVYAVVRERLRLRELKQELVEQLERVSAAARMKRLGQEASFESKAQRRFTVLGIAIALIGLLQVALTTPVQVGTFVRAWGACFQEGVSCFTEQQAGKAAAVVSEPMLKAKSGQQRK